MVPFVPFGLGFQERVRARERIGSDYFSEEAGTFANREPRIANLVIAVSPFFFSAPKNLSEESRGND
jgi:hypothetical protein